MNFINRRHFIKKTAIPMAALPFIGFLPNAFNANESINDSVINQNLSINIFSKCLQFLDCKTVGETAAEIGFSGVDLTVRPKGHVLPEMVKIDLPKAVTDIQASGINCNMISTNIESVSNPLDIDILETASNSTIHFYRTNWFKYKKEMSLPDSLLFYQNEIKKLGDLNQKLGIVGCYQNHAGTNIGATFWEIYELLKTVNPEYFGAQYDIRHAMVENTYSWKNGFKLLYPSIKVIVLKDYKWSLVNGNWKVINVPIGEGIVDFTNYFKLLKQYHLKPPVSLHVEYNLGGAEKGNRNISVDKKVIFNALKKDLNTIQKLWKNA